MRHNGDGFVTTSRGKKDIGDVFVRSVDHTEHIIYASGKATMNTPLLDAIFKGRPNINVILHDHKQLPGVATVDYQLPGTVSEVSIEKDFGSNNKINIKHHGYIACFATVEQALRWQATL